VNRVSSLQRRVFVLLAAGLLVFVLAGCDWGQPTGLSVNGQDVSMSQLFKEFDALAKVNPQFGATDGHYDTATTASYLTSRVQGMLVHQEFEARHLKLTDAQRSQARQQLVSSLAGASSTSSGSTDSSQQQAEATFKKLPVWFQNQLIDTTAEQIALQDSFNSSGPSLEQEAQQVYDATKDQYEQYCLSAIATTDEATANQAKALVEAGQDFATVAKQVSIDPSKDQGGAIGCTSIGNLSSALGTNLPKANVGDILGPVSYGNGYVILKVTSVKPQTFEDVKDEIEQSLPQPGAQQLNTLIAKKLKDADVSINPRLGTWVLTSDSSNAGPHIAPPKGAEPASEPAGPLASLPAGAANGPAAAPSS
jgi:parvulin-like peptidyl-prolyl isomerase